MLNSLIEIFLGCIHEYVQPEFIPLCDAVFVPAGCAIMLIFVCAFCVAMVHALTAVIVHDTKK